ncbi:MAG: hypothetical protein M2R45_04936 [Verrucomicrobia subdivision 3 bacterium]|nr:hypothetical protein [Limisphaerales bacterium]MCS1415627.1 hypothetical protein [Limisphaerales bacterium]
MPESKRETGAVRFGESDDWERSGKRAVPAAVAPPVFEAAWPPAAGLGKSSRAGTLAAAQCPRINHTALPHTSSLTQRTRHFPLFEPQPYFFESNFFDRLRRGDHYAPSSLNVADCRRHLYVSKCIKIRDSGKYD